MRVFDPMTRQALREGRKLVRWNKGFDRCGCERGRGEQPLKNAFGSSTSALEDLIGPSRQQGGREPGTGDKQLQQRQMLCLIPADAFFALLKKRRGECYLSPPIKMDARTCSLMLELLDSVVTHLGEIHPLGRFWMERTRQQNGEVELPRLACL